MNAMIIDPPVGPYSEAGDIEAWLVDLRKLPENDDVRDAIAQAEEWLNTAKNAKDTALKSGSASGSLS